MFKSIPSMWLLLFLTAVPLSAAKSKPVPLREPPNPETFQKLLRVVQGKVGLNDNLSYLQGERAFANHAFDSALAINLSAVLPADGALRDSLLLQRSRLSEVLWPPDSAQKGEGPEILPSRYFEIGLGSARSAARYSIPPEFPFGNRPAGMDSGYWLYDTHARLTWPISFQKHLGSVTIRTNLSRPADSLDYDLGLEANVPAVFLENLSLSGSGAVGRQTGIGYVTSLGCDASLGWYWESASLFLNGGYAGQRRDGWELQYETYSAALSGEFFQADGKSLSLSLGTTLQRLAPQHDRYTFREMYVDDVSQSAPTHYSGPDFVDSIPKDSRASYLLYASHSGGRALAFRAPQTSLSVAPSLTYGFPLPQGISAHAEFHAGWDLFPVYAWDRATMPDSFEPFSGDFDGIALNRADGREYMVVLVRENGGFSEYYGSEPLEHHRDRRLDRRLGSGLTLARAFPSGHFLSFSASAERTWTNLPAGSPAWTQPWQWGLDLNWSRVWEWR